MKPRLDGSFGNSHHLGYLRHGQLFFEPEREEQPSFRRQLLQFPLQSEIEGAAVYLLDDMRVGSHFLLFARVQLVLLPNLVMPIVVAQEVEADGEEPSAEARAAELVARCP